MHGATVGCGVASQATGGLSVGVSLRLQEENVFVALRGRRPGAPGPGHAEQGRRSKKTNDFVKCKSHIPSIAFKTEISHS
jgi:hypothetical protein